MTTPEAIFVLSKSGVILSNSIKRQIAAILGQQAAEIDRLNELLGQRCGDCHLRVEEAADNG